MKRFLLAAALLALAVPAAAQVNVVPQVGVNSNNIRQNTYSAIILGLVPAASSTDFLCINGSSSKTIHITRIALSGTAGTLVTTAIVLLHRATLDTGTAATSTYVKAAAPLASSMPAATATVVGYNSTGGVPTINDTSPTYIRNAAITLNLSGTTAAPADRLVWTFGSDIDFYAARLVIPSGATTEQYCLNLNAVSVSAGVLSGSIEWMEY